MWNVSHAVTVAVVNVVISSGHISSYSFVGQRATVALEVPRGLHLWASHWGACSLLSQPLCLAGQLVVLLTLPLILLPPSLKNAFLITWHLMRSCPSEDA